MQKSTAEITRIVEETVQGLGYEFVDFERLPRGLMRITIDSQAEGGVGVDDCEAVSNQITALFTVEGIDYERLEVASPGVERPLKRASEWARFVGRPAHVELYEPMKAEGFPEAGRRKLDGIILGIGRAVGEATATQMVIGNAMSGPTFNPFDISATLTTQMLMGIGEAVSGSIGYDIRFSAGILLMIILFAIDIVLNKIKDTIHDNMTGQVHVSTFKKIIATLRPFAMRIRSLGGKESD